MDWSLTRPEQGNLVGQSDDFIEEQVKRNVAFAKLVTTRDIMNWRKPGTVEGLYSSWTFTGDCDTLLHTYHSHR